jgi:hypothetical protein
MGKPGRRQAIEVGHVFRRALTYRLNRQTRVNDQDRFAFTTTITANISTNASAEDSQMTATARLRTLPVSFLKELPRLILIGLFSLAALDKLMHFRGFVIAIQSYQMLPARLESFAAIFFIMAEFAIAVGLLTKRWRGPACLSAVLLLSLFTVVYMATDPGRVCGCWFTLTLNSGGYVHILQNVVFIGLAILTWMDHKSSKPDRLSVSYSTSTSSAEPDDGRLKPA